MAATRAAALVLTCSLACAWSMRASAADPPSRRAVVHNGADAVEAVEDADASVALQGVPTNDDCFTPESIIGPGSFTFDNSIATLDGPSHAACNFFGHPDFNHDVWFCWTATETGPWLLETCGGTSVDTKIAVYDGCTCPPGDGNLLGCSDDDCGSALQSSVTFSAVAGQSYLLRIGTYPTASGGSGTMFLTSLGTGADCCTAHPTTGCDDPVVESCVCGIDSFCCSMSWDGACVDEADQFCGAGCTGDCIGPGEDCWATQCNGNTIASFADTPIPADFFDMGSAPFTGTIELGGASGGFAPDTHLLRQESMCLPPPFPATAQVAIELTQLDLVSCAPITVVGSGDWDVEVHLSSSMPSLGTMTVIKTDPNGGTFSSEFDVHPMYTFSRVGNPTDQRFLDFDVPPGFDGTVTLQTAGSSPWSTDESFEACSQDGFAPGVTTDTNGFPCCVEVCHSSYGTAPHEHCSTQPKCVPCTPPSEPEPCGECGPGPHWIDQPLCPPGVDNMPSGALVGIDLDLDCVADNSYVLSGPVQIQRSGAQDDSSNYPGVRPVDGHLDVIDTQIQSMSVTGGSLTLTAGAGLGNMPLDPTLGVIAEDFGNPALGDSFFDVFFEVDLGGSIFLYNQDAVTVTDTITCIPPVGNYLHPVGCTPLYTSPIPGSGVHMANLVSARHETFPVPRDRWRTWRYIGKKDQNYQDFSSSPIPADFFDPGSEPFVGRIEFDGKPLNQDNYGDADTEILRGADPVLPSDPAGTMGTVDIQITELSLISIRPITVRYNDAAAELWDVSVELSVVPQPLGSLTATKTHANGGTFDSVLPVLPRFEFTRRDDGTTRVLDAGLSAMPPMLLESSSVGFVHTVDPSVDIVVSPNTEFIPGVEETTPGNPGSQQVQVFDEEELLARHRICPPRRKPPRDRWYTVHDGIPERNYQDVTLGGGFFGPGSDPFTGRIEFEGVPLNQAELGNTDTIVERDSDPVGPGDANGTMGSTDIQIVELNLHSVEPIVVTFSGEPTLWDVRASLSEIPPAPGTLTATKTHANGGTFDSVLNVQPLLTFNQIAATCGGGDTDGDGDVDDVDTQKLADCLTGPNGSLDSGCECVDADGSGTVDLLDAAEFQKIFTGDLTTAGLPEVSIDAGTAGLNPLNLVGTNVPFVFSAYAALDLAIPDGATFVPALEETIPGDETSQVPVPTPEEELLARHTICPPRKHCNIRITTITGARKNIVGNFDQLPDPHDPGRLFIDTVTAGPILGSPDHEDVTLEVQLGPPGLDRTKYEVLWEVRDPDDPADHMDIDPNDNGNPTGGMPNGGDNVDTLPEETTDGHHFFRMANHAISNRMSPGSDGMNASTVIGKATTQIDAALKSSVKFHYGDEAGDNYIITACCVRKLNGMRDSCDQTGIQTTWRKRELYAYAMVNTNGGNYRILSNAAAIQTAAHNAYANSAANKNAYMDIVVTEPAGSQATAFFESIDCDCPPPVGGGACDPANNAPATCQDIGSYAIDHTNYHGGGGSHANNRYQIIGVKTQQTYLGDTGREPHSYVAVYTLKTLLHNVRGVRDEPFAIPSGRKIKITVANEDGSGSMSVEITFDSAAFADGMATAAEVAAKIIADRGALPISASSFSFSGQTRIVIYLTAGGSDKTIQVDDVGGGGVCAALGIVCGQEVDDAYGMTRTSMHEVGHTQFPKNDTMHNLADHTANEGCLFYQTGANSSQTICPEHIRELRNDIPRSWSAHDRCDYPATINTDSN